MAIFSKNKKGNGELADKYHEHSDLVERIARLHGEIVERMARVEERTADVQETHDRFITRELSTINTKMDEFQKSLSQLFVTRAEFNAQFEPMRKLMYLVVTLIASALIVAILGMLFNVGPAP